MGNSRIFMTIMGILIFIMSPEANAQFFKKLKQQAEEKLLNKANKEVGDYHRSKFIGKIKRWTIFLPETKAQRKKRV